MDLSVIIMSYNTATLTVDCLNSLTFFLNKEKKLKSEIIIVDNFSSDGSVENIREFLKKSQIPIHFIENKKNVGYGAANNQGVKKSKGEFILLLNSDTLIENISFTTLLEYMKQNSKIGTLTVKVRFPHGEIDPASHRGFPTIWRSFCFFSRLEKISTSTLLSRIFGGYHLTWCDLSKIHEIDCPSGAFFLIPKIIYEKVKGFDEKFFMYGEDLDLAFRIKQLGYKVVYYPKYTILHLKHQSGLKATEEIRKKTKYHFYDAMKIFYHKHYAKNYPKFFNSFIYSVIDFKAKSSL